MGAGARSRLSGASARRRPAASASAPAHAVRPRLGTRAGEPAPDTDSRRVGKQSATLVTAVPLPLPGVTFALSHHQEISKPRLSDASLRGKPSREGVCGLAWAGGGRSRRQGPLVPALAAGVRAQAPRGPAAAGREHPDGAQALAAASERDPQGPLLGKRHLHRSQRRCPVPTIVPRTLSFLNAPGAGASYGHAAPASASPSPRGAVAGARLGSASPVTARHWSTPQQCHAEGARSCRNPQGQA